MKLLTKPAVHPLVFALLGYVLFSCKDVLTRLGLHDLSVWQILTLQAAGALVCLLGHTAVTGNWRVLRPRRATVVITVAGLAVAGELAFNYVLPRMHLATLFVLICVTPLLVAVLAWILLKEHLRPLQMAAVFIAFCGALVMVLAQHGDKVGTVATPLTYAVVLCAITIGAFRTIVIRSAAALEQPRALLFGTMSLMLVVSLPFSWPAFAALPPWGAHAAAALELYAPVAFTGALAMAGNLLVWSSLKRVRAAYVQAMQYSQLLWSTLAGYAIWAETPAAVTILGGLVVIGAGGYLIATVRMRAPAAIAPEAGATATN